MAELERTLAVHAQELATLGEASKSSQAAVYIQNCATAIVHQASPKAFGRALCGWKYDGPTARARRQVDTKSYRPLPSLDGIPGDMICDRCLPEARLAAFNKDLVHDELSGDEQPADVQDD